MAAGAVGPLADATRIYAIGDAWAPGTFMRLNIYMLRTHRWSTGTPSIYDYEGCAVVLGHDGRVYVMGGGTEENSRLNNSLKAYNPHTARWISLAPFAQPGLYRPAAAVGKDGRIYLLAGAAGYGNASAVAHVYDPRSNRWTILPPMRRRRTAFGAVAGPDGRIYAIGGSPEATDIYYDPTDPTDPTDPAPYGLRSVEIYDPHTNRWTWGPSLHVARWGLSAVLGPNNTIYAIGGSSGRTVETLTLGTTSSRN